MTTPQDSRVTVEPCPSCQGRDGWHRGTCFLLGKEIERHIAALASRPTAAASGDDELTGPLRRWILGEDGFLSPRQIGELTALADRIEALPRAQPLGGDEVEREVMLDNITNILSYHYEGPVSHDAKVAELVLAALTEQKEKRA